MKLTTFILLGLCFGLASPYAFSGVNNKLSDDISYCLKIKNSDVRLACYDELAHKNLAKLSSTALNAQRALHTDQGKLQQKIDDFSKEDITKTEEDNGLESITATVSKLHKLIRGQWIIDLANGQRWQQKGSAVIKLKKGDVVVLKKRALGAVYLSKKNNARSIRVKRLK